jgi:hypothetical protein
VILSITGRRYDGGGFGHLGEFGTRVEVETIEGIRSISEEEFEQVLESIR